MQDITIGVLGGGLVFIVGLITSWKALKNSFKEGITEMLDDKFDKIDTKFQEVNDKIDNIESKIDLVELASCKNYIVPYLADLDRGGIPDELEKQRFFDAYETYIKHGGNSYIQEKVAQLRIERKL